MRNKIRVSMNFFLSEFECRCCGRVMLDSVLLEKLQKLRDAIGMPIYIVSGYRCEKHNITIKGAKKSQHLLGKAADIHARSYPLGNLLEKAEKIGFGGIGTYPKGGFLHLDVRKEKTRWVK